MRPASTHICWNRSIQIRKSSTPIGLVWNNNKIAVGSVAASLLWTTNMATMIMMSCENDLHLSDTDRKSIQKFLKTSIYNKNAFNIDIKSRLLGDLVRNEDPFLNEKVINSRRNRIYSLKVFHFLLYRQLSILQVFYFLYRLQRFVSELIQYVCQRRPEIRL